MTDAQSAQPATPDDVPHPPTVPAQALPPMPVSSPQADTDTTAAPEPEPAADTTTVPNPGRRRTILTALAGAAAGAALVGTIWAVTANSGPDKPGTFTLTGKFALTDYEGVTTDTGDEGACRGDGGYDDIAAGTSVTVYDASGTTVATGSIGTPEYDTGTCTFDVNVPDVPKGHKFYSVEISHRGKVQLTAEEAEAGEFASTLG